MTQTTLETEAVRPPHPHPSARPYRRTTVWLVVGFAALIMALWWLGTPAGIQGKANAIGYAICHRIADHSFQINGQPLPLCARCTGIYLGVMTGFAILIAAGRGRASRLPPVRVLIMLAVFVGLMGLDGINSFLYLFPGYSGPYEPQNWLRLITGSLAGIAMINLIYPVFHTSVWARPDPRRTLHSLWELTGMAAVVVLVDALVITENPTLLLIFGLVSTVGPVLILTLSWSVLFLSMARRENSAHTRRDLIIPLLAGLALAFLMLGAIDGGRYLLTGTWDGFDFSTLAAR